MMASDADRRSTPTTSVVIGTAGHIDHGKSALVRALTGTDPDRLKEEKARGITIDLGFAHLEAGGVSLAFVDVPGHERFVKNMLAGVGGIDLVLMVVAANESVMPQTREHFHICRLLEVPAGVIVLTKVDLADPDMLEVARLEVAALAAGSFLAGAPMVAVSSKTGEGLDELRDTLTRTAGTLRARHAEGPLRLPIDRVFSMKGFGTVVTGTLVSGEIAEHQEAQILPGDLRVKVRGLQVHGHHESVVGSGRRVAVNVGGVDLADLRRGQTMVRPGTFDTTRRLDAAIEMLADAPVLTHGARIRFHHGTSELIGRVAIAGDRRGQEPAFEVLPGGSAHVRVRLEADAVLTRGDRFILRAYSPPVTIGGGVVLDPHPPRTAIRTPAGRARLSRLDGGGTAANPTDAAILAFLDERGAAGLERSALVSRAGLSAEGAAAAIDRLAGSGQVVGLSGRLVSTAVLEDLRTRLVAAVTTHHRSQPLSEGLPREEARERVFGRAAPVVFEHVVDMLVGSGVIVARDRLAMAGHERSLSSEERHAYEAVGRIYGDAGLTPPDPAAVARAADADSALIDRVVTLLVREKALVRVGGALLFHADALARLKSDVRALKAGEAGRATVDVATFKERYGISRKYAIPLLEYLDRERITRRVGDVRVVL